MHAHVCPHSCTHTHTLPMYTHTHTRTNACMYASTLHTCIRGLLQFTSSWELSCCSGSFASPMPGLRQPCPSWCSSHPVIRRSGQWLCRSDGICVSSAACSAVGPGCCRLSAGPENHHGASRRRAGGLFCSSPGLQPWVSSLSRVLATSEKGLCPQTRSNK